MKTLFLAIDKMPDISVFERSDYGGETYLSIFLHSNVTENVVYSNSKQRIVDVCFHSETTLSDDSDDHYDSQPQNINSFYRMLKDAHQKKIPKQLNLEEFQSSALRPTLRPYQLQAVYWLLQRERVTDHLHVRPIILRSDRFPGQIFYMDPINYKITDYLPEPRSLPKGGLLCDEMGLGKESTMRNSVYSVSNLCFVFRKNC